MEFIVGKPNTIVTYSDKPGIAFEPVDKKLTDFGPSSYNTIWSSGKIMSEMDKKLNQLIRVNTNPQNLTIPKPSQNVNNKISLGNQNFGGEFHFKTPHMPIKNLYKPTNYGAVGYHMYRVPRALRLSWYMSFLIPGRDHYCRKCCNYNEHLWSSKWKDDPRYNDYACPKKCENTIQ